MAKNKKKSKDGNIKRGNEEYAEGVGRKGDIGGRGLGKIGEIRKGDLGEILWLHQFDRKTLTLKFRQNNLIFPLTFVNFLQNFS